MIYLDHNATSPLLPEVAELLARSFSNRTTPPGNPSSVHRAGREARSRLDAARAKVGQALGFDGREVCFTASGSESVALAIKGVFGARKDKKRNRLVATAIEHPAVLTALAHLESEGAEVVLIPPGPDGRVPADAVRTAIDDRTALCSVMWANNETGVLQPVKEIAESCRNRGVLFHTDAVQAVGKQALDTQALRSVDLLSVSGHKFGAPAGVGALLVRRGIGVQALTPGHQENGMRGGTQNVWFIEALALALERRLVLLEEDSQRIAALRDRFEARLVNSIPGVSINGSTAARVANTSSVTFDGADGEALLIALDLRGICASSGAACASGSLKPSHVLLGMGRSAAQASATLRFSLSAANNATELDRVVEALIEEVPRAREAAKLGA